MESYDTILEKNYRLKSEIKTASHQCLIKFYYKLKKMI
jgi:hypothetical protein